MSHCKTIDEVGHDWVHRNEEDYKGGVSSGSFTWHQDKVYSYAQCIARECQKEDVILVIDWDYSPTTANHNRILRQAIPSYKTTLAVNNPTADSKPEHLKNYDDLIHDIDNITRQIAKGRNGTYAQDTRLVIIANLIRTANQYTKIFKLGSTLQRCFSYRHT